MINRPKLAALNGLAPQIEWSFLPCGPAGGKLCPAGSDPTQATFTGTAFGCATITARYTLPDGITVLTGSMPIIIAPEQLVGCDVLEATAPQVYQRLQHLDPAILISVPNI